MRKYIEYASLNYKSKIMKNSKYYYSHVTSNSTGKSNLLTKYIQQESPQSKNISRLILQNALKNEEFTPWFQPVICAESRKLAGCEVLARWIRPGVGMMSPNTFIPMAEQTRLSVPLVTQLMRKTGTILKDMWHTLPKGFYVGFNVSAADISAPEFRSNCLILNDLMRGRGFNLLLEITERMPFSVSTESIAELKFLRDSGIYLALDDFGTGYSSFQLLQHCPVDYLKIDKSFIHQQGSDHISTCIVDSIIGLAHKLELKIIAEGIETQKQARVMTDKGIHYLQGFLYSPPVPGECFTSERFMYHVMHQ
ncbi:TPA: EAL domain-containing protein [Escherichia coli]